MPELRPGSQLCLDTGDGRYSDHRRTRTDVAPDRGQYGMAETPNRVPASESGLAPMALAKTLKYIVFNNRAPRRKYPKVLPKPRWLARPVTNGTRLKSATSNIGLAEIQPPTVATPDAPRRDDLVANPTSEPPFNTLPHLRSSQTARTILLDCNPDRFAGRSDACCCDCARRRSIADQPSIEIRCVPLG